MASGCRGKVFDGGLAAGGNQGLVAVAFEGELGVAENQLFVVDDEDRGGAGGRAGAVGSTMRGGRLRRGGAGEENLDGGSAADRGLDADDAAVAADDARDGGEAEPAAGELGGEEGIEDAARGCPRPCRSRCRAPPGRRSGPARQVADGRGRRAARRRRPIAARSRTPTTPPRASSASTRVEDQIRDHLLDLPGVRLDFGQAGSRSRWRRTPPGSVGLRISAVLRTAAERSSFSTKKRPPPE